MKKVIALTLAVLLALACLAGCGQTATTTTATATAAPAAATAAPAAADTAATEAPAAEKPTIKVGSKDFTEQLLLGQITIKYLEANGYTCVDKTNVSGSDVCWKALGSGDFDVYWDYTGTIWGSFLGNTTFPEGGKDGLYKAVVEGLAKEGKYCVGDMMPMNDAYGLVVTQDVAAKGITTYSELGAYMTAHPGELVFCGDHEFTIREDGLLGLSDAYGIDFGEDLNVMDMGLVFQALKDKQGDVGMVFATDSRIAAFDLVLLKDDKGYFPAYNAVSCFRTDFAEKYPEVVTLMNNIAPLITDDVMMSLNYKVDVDEEEPDAVAEAWLKEVGLIS